MIYQMVEDLESASFVVFTDNLDYKFFIKI